MLFIKSIFYRIFLFLGYYYVLISRFLNKKEAPKFLKIIDITEDISDYFNSHGEKNEKLYYFEILGGADYVSQKITNDKCLNKIIDIINEKFANTSLSEIFTPYLIPKETWENDGFLGIRTEESDFYLETIMQNLEVFVVSNLDEIYTGRKRENEEGEEGDEEKEGDEEIRNEPALKVFDITNITFPTFDPTFGKWKEYDKPNYHILFEEVAKELRQILGKTIGKGDYIAFLNQKTIKTTFVPFYPDE